MRKSLLLTAAAAILFAAQPAFCVPVTYLVEGQITDYRWQVSSWPEGVDLPPDLLIGTPLTGTITYDPDLADPDAEPSYARWLPTIKYEFYFGEFKFFSGPTPPPVSYLDVYEHGFFFYDEVPWYNEVHSSPIGYLGPEHLWFNSLGEAGDSTAALPETLPFSDLNEFHVYLNFAPGNRSLSIDATFRVIEVPEPAPFGLFILGSILVLLGFRFMKRR